MLLLSAVVGAEEEDAVHELAGVLTFLRESAGWVPPAEPWDAPSHLFGSDAWLAGRDR